MGLGEVSRVALCDICDVYISIFKNLDATK